MIRPVSLFIALRYLRTKRRNRFASFVSVASVFGVGLGIAVLVIVSSVMNGFEKEVARHVLDMTSHAVVFRPGRPLDDWRTLAERILRVPGVEAVAPFVRAGGMLNHRGEIRGVTVQGLDVARETTVSGLPRAIGTDALERLNATSDGVLLGATLAETLRLDTGDRVTLIAPRWNAATGAGAPHYVPLTVVGTFSVGMHDFDAAFAVLPLARAATTFDIAGVSGLRLKLSDAARAPQVAANIVTTIDADLAAVNWTQYHRNFFLAIGSQKRIMFAILFLIVAVAAFNIVASMIMIVKEKERDIAVLRTIGLPRRAVMAVFVVQGVLIGIAGVVLGVALGMLGARQAHLVVAFVERMLDMQFIKPDVYFIDYLPVDVRTGDIGFISVVAFTICVVATLYPAWRASRTLPAQALRYE